MSAINDVDYSTKNLTQPSNLLHLPQDVLQVIMHKVADEHSPMKSAIRAVEFGRVCTYTHMLTQVDADIDALINDEKKFQPFGEFLFSIIRGILDQNEADFCLHVFRYFFETKDYESAKKAIKDLFEDFERDHPGVEDLVQEIIAQMKAYCEKEPEYKKDLFKIYYTIFKKSVAEIFGKPYEECVEKFDRFVPFVAKACKVIDSDPSEVREFSRKILRDVVDQFADKPLHDISIDAYKYFVSELCNWFNRIPQEIHELFLRQAILTHHDKEEIEAIRDKYAKPSHELLIWIKSELKEKRTEAFRLVEGQIHYLCGDNFNGAIDEAYRSMRAEEPRLNHAKSAYQSALMAQSQENSDLTNGQTHVNETFETYKKGLQQFEKKRHEFEKHKAQLAQLAVWTNGVITSGKKFDLEAGLQEEKLTADARSFCQKNSEFYSQLAKPIDEDNHEDLYKQLHKII
jgi:hypothetical protein